MTLPTVSIVVPSFNQARYLNETLESLCNQRDQIHELIVMDGGSDDGSREIIEQFRGQYPELIPIYKKNGGQLIFKLTTIFLSLLSSEIQLFY